MRPVYFGNSPIRQSSEGGQGELVERDGEEFYRIGNFHRMPPFFLTLVSGFDHWMFVSSTGGLTCGRVNPDNALFPYYTDDKIHDAYSTTGPKTNLLVEYGGKTFLWRPFSQEIDVYVIERNLYKSVYGNKLIFEEINRDLEMAFSYGLSTCERFGFVKNSTVENLGAEETRVEVMDGLRNILPFGVPFELQATMSTLLDAYKQAERIEGLDVGLYTLSSILTDRAEPNEALKATVVWSLGLDEPQVLLSEDQAEAFCEGFSVSDESFRKGQRGAFFVCSAFPLSPGGAKNWMVLADVNQGPSDLPALLDVIRQGISTEAIEQEINQGSTQLLKLAGSADGCQFSSDRLLNVRHFSNSLFNIMRGGTFYDEYNFPADDFFKFSGNWNDSLSDKLGPLLNFPGEVLKRSAVMAAVEESGDADLQRIALEYLPLTFSRRHGDPSRPWNRFSIDIRDSDGSDKLSYQGNWRDIFQNWEALAFSYPEYIESFITKFVNASTADGYNPYRISNEGIDWEVLDPKDPWSNIGYWGDHQINYLLNFLVLSSRFQPGKLNELMIRKIFVYANVPYRLRGYEALKRNPRNSVDYDEDQASVIAGRVAQIGSDGKLVTLPGGSIHKASLLEKLLVAGLVKIGNLAPGGGIWMNSQRPEWNDANNALVGYGLSMVTLCYLRRFLVILEKILSSDTTADYSVSEEVAWYFNSVHDALKSHGSILETAIGPEDRKAFMDRMGSLGEEYRERIYHGFSSNRSRLERTELIAFIDLALAYLDHSIAHNRRADGLFHSYNLIHFGDDGYSVERLGEMLEGQVAVLSSGYLYPEDSLALLDALRASKIYRSDQNSYMLYPYIKLPGFLEKNIIPAGIVEESPWIQNELASGRRKFVEQDSHGRVHFNSDFQNEEQLRLALKRAGDVGEEESDALRRVYEQVFGHVRFTGRSGSMYKYEGLGCIYWHMVSKLLLATSEVITLASGRLADQQVLKGLFRHFDDLKEGLGIHKTPAQYGAFPVDPYSHTPAFTGVQQPGMTGQVKEDIITRFIELGVRVSDGQIEFAPILLKRSEFLSKAANWRYSTGGAGQNEELESGTLAFSLCGVPVIYRLAKDPVIHVHAEGRDVETIRGRVLGTAWSQSLFHRDRSIRKIVVDVKESMLR
jgi:hypothetical protein